MNEEELRKKYDEYVAFVKRQKALKQSLKNIEADKEGYRATSGMTVGEKIRAGIGSGLLSVVDRAGNLVGAGGRFSDEAIAAKNEVEKDLLSTGAGAGGRLVGQIAATAPLGVLGRAAGAIPGVARAASTAAKVPGLARVAGATGAALEGGAAGALMSNPGEGAGAALTGAAFGGGLNALGQVGGKFARSLRPKITENARRIMDRTGEHIPISQAAPPDSLTRTMFGGVVANLPGQQLRKQAHTATDAVREDLFSMALPHNVPVNSVFQYGDDVHTAMKNARKAWASAFDDTNKAVVTGFDVPAPIVKAIRRRKPNAVIPKTGTPITGRDMATFKQYVSELIRENSKSAFTRSRVRQLKKVAENVDKRMYRDLLRQRARGSDGEPLWRTYAQNSKKYANWLKIDKAAKSAQGGEFTPQKWEEIVRKSNLRESVKDFADDAAKALPKFPSNFGPFQMVAATSLAGGAGLGAFSAGPDASLGERALRALGGAASVYGIGRGLSSKPAQHLFAQYGEKGLLDRYPALLREAFRNAAISNQVSEEE